MRGEYHDELVEFVQHDHIVLLRAVIFIGQTLVCEADDVSLECHSAVALLKI